MSAIALAAFLGLAVANAPAVAPETLASVVCTESGFNALAVHDNSSGASYAPATRAEAEALASALIARGDSLDLGIAQINTRAGHLQRRGLPFSAAFEPAVALRVGAEVLTECWRRAAGADEQARLRQAIGCYNGDKTGAYVARVERCAARIVPAIRVAGGAPPPGTDAQAKGLPEAPAPMPPDLQDMLHPQPPVRDDAAPVGLRDALHPSARPVVGSQAPEAPPSDPGDAR